MDKRTTHRIVRDLIGDGEHKAALRVVVRHCENDKEFINGIVLWYCNNSRSILPIPPVSAYNFAGPYVAMASPRVTRRFVQDLVDLGMAERAAYAAQNFLRRSLTEQEVRELVMHYVNDTGVTSSSDESKLIDLAYQVGGYVLKHWADERIDEFRRRQREMPDL